VPDAGIVGISQSLSELSGWSVHPDGSTKLTVFVSPAAGAEAVADPNVALQRARSCVTVTDAIVAEPDRILKLAERDVTAVLD
jgi:hypothetical protein